jgi:hypothetical protein
MRKGTDVMPADETARYIADELWVTNAVELVYWWQFLAHQADGDLGVTFRSSCAFAPQVVAEACPSRPW